MCGINAVYSYHPAALPVDRDELLATRDAMARRGPDGAGEWISKDGRVGLGHRRLTIIDLTEAGAQPMESEDRSTVITFNGEIYNYRAIRSALSESGCRFRSQSDTEVILALYEREGVEGFRKLRGMYAFVLWDSRRRHLVMARDPLGIKPLYYADDGWTLRAASQVRALRAGGAVSSEPDPAGIAGFYLTGSVPEPFTIYRGIRPLPAGHVLVAGETGPHPPSRMTGLAELYRSAGSTNGAARDGRGAPSDAARSALLDSVRHHLVSDVPVGAFLSAGVDSTVLVSLAREVDPAPLRTVTLAFDEYRNTENDESPLAEETARRLGTDHETRLITRERFLRELPAVLDAMDQPTVDGINSYFISQAAAASGLKVALSGLGGDELVGGYPSFRDVPRMVRLAAVPSLVPGLGRASRPLVERLIAGRAPGRYAGLFESGGSYAGAYLLRRGLFTARELPAVLGRDLAVEGLERLNLPGIARETLEPDPGTPFSRVAVLEASLYMRNQLLRDADWASMAHSLEVRVPLVDAVLWRDFALGIGTAGSGRSKALLASATRPPLPANVAGRPKTGFQIPVWEWAEQATGLDAWRRVSLLAQPGPQGARRWAHTVMETFLPDMGGRPS